MTLAIVMASSGVGNVAHGYYNVAEGDTFRTDLGFPHFLHLPSGTVCGGLAQA